MTIIEIHGYEGIFGYFWAQRMRTKIIENIKDLRLEMEDESGVVCVSSNFKDEFGF